MKKEAPQSPDEIAKALRARAGDYESLNQHSGPRAVPAVRAALLHLADIISGDNAMVHKRAKVAKRQLV